SSVVSLRLVLSNPTLPEIAGDNPVSYTTQRDTIADPVIERIGQTSNPLHTATVKDVKNLSIAAMISVRPECAQQIISSVEREFKGVNPDQLLRAKQYPRFPTETLEALRTGAIRGANGSRLGETHMLEFTRACARSSEVIVVAAALVDSDVYNPETRLFRYEKDGKLGKQWYFDDFDFHTQHITLFRNPEIDPASDYLTYPSSEGDVFHSWWKGNFREKIRGAGTWVDDAEGRGRMLAISQIGDALYACGQGGQIYRRAKRDSWSPLTDALLFDMDSYLAKINGPDTSDPNYLEWITNLQQASPKNVSLNDIKGLSDNAIYICGEEGTRPKLFYWDGGELHEQKVYLEEAALTGIFIEHEDSVWVCGREGVLLHGSFARGFTPVNLRQQLNLFHMITPYRGKIILLSSVRPGGLFEVTPWTSELRRFSSAMPKLRGEYIFYAKSVNDILWVAGQNDILRFDGKEWERIEHPDI
ncbi:hypothetical protein G6L88_23980, partial [Rhizobium skierniewicense]|nr:hypothetical protein [Rhizobium skierniewicense]